MTGNFSGLGLLSDNKPYMAPSASVHVAVLDFNRLQEFEKALIFKN